jgi:hypothetical protein
MQGKGLKLFLFTHLSPWTHDAQSIAPAAKESCSFHATAFFIKKRNALVSHLHHT